MYRHVTMELRHLRHFEALAVELHFGRAARRLAISQPPLSLSIRQLENELGVRLFERNNRMVRLSAAGQAYLPEVRRILTEIEHARRIAQRAHTGVSGRLRIGLVASMLYRGLPQRIQAFQRAFPEIDVVLREANSAEQIEALRAGALDLGFVHAPTQPPGLQGRPYLTEPFLACLPKGHRRASRRGFGLAALADESFVLFAREASPAYYERIVALCVRAGFEPRVSHEVRHWMTVLALVAAGMGVALVPASMARAGLAGVVFREIGDDASSITRMLWASAEPAPVLRHAIDSLAPTESTALA